MTKRTPKITVYLFFALTALEMFFANFAHPVTPTIIKTLNLPAYTFGVAFASMSLTNFLFGPFWGRMSDRIGRIKMYVLCMFGYALGQYLFGQATTEYDIFLARIIAGFFIAGIGVFQVAYLLDIVAPQERGRMLSIETALIAISAAFGYLAGGVIGEFSIPLVFAIMVGGLAISGILTGLLLKDVIETKKEHLWSDIMKESNPFSAFSVTLKDMTLMLALFFATVLLIQFGFTAYEQSFNYYLRDQFGLGSSYNGVLKAGFGILGLLVNSTISLYLVRKTKIKKPVLVLISLATSGAIALLFTQEAFSFILVSVGFFTVTTILWVLIQTLAVHEVPKGKEGAFMGFYNSIKALGMIFGSLSAGFIYTSGPKNAFILSAIVFALALSIYAFTLRKQRTNI